VVTALAVRTVRRGTVVVTAVAAGVPALVAVQFSQLARELTGGSLAALAENPAIRTLFGPPVALDDPGGFAVWRTGTVVAVLVGIWAASTATRATRGEEEAGRWDLLLAGRLRLRDLLLRQVAVVLCACAVVGCAVATGLVLAGTAVPGALVFGAGIGGTGMLGAALGALTAQLLAERRAASGTAVSVLLAGLLLRMVADGQPALGWLHWLSPFGLIARSAPFAGDRVLPLAVLAVAGLLHAVALYSLVLLHYGAADASLGERLKAAVFWAPWPARAEAVVVAGCALVVGLLAVRVVRASLAGADPDADPGTGTPPSDQPARQGAPAEFAVRRAHRVWSAAEGGLALRRRSPEPCGGR
jgi:hypothetical protein